MNDRSRPKAAPETPAKTSGLSVSDSTGIGTQLRRRFDASLRCEPLDDGRRDPWTSRRRKSAPNLTIEPFSRYTAEVHGTGAFRVLAAAGVKGMWAHERTTRRPSCWTIPLWSVPAIVDAARRLGGHAEIADAQLGLFE